MTLADRHQRLRASRMVVSLVLVALFLLLTPSNTATAQDAPGLFVPVDEQRMSLDARQSHLLEVIKARRYAEEVRIVRGPNAPGLLRRSSVALNVDAGKRFTVGRSRVKQRAPEQFTWIGHVPDQRRHVLLVVDGSDITGRIHTRDSVYTVHPLGAGLHALVRVDQSALPPDEPPGFGDEKQEAGPNAPGDVEEANEGGISGKTMSVQSNPVVDLLVVYTQAAATASGNISSVINGSIDATNETLGNSSVPATVAKVHQAQVSYSESGSAYTDRGYLVGTTDGYMDNVHSLRDQYGADVVVLIVSSLNACGIAGGIGIGASDAFAVVRWDCAVGNYSFAHEVGHILGARHNDECDSGTSPYPYGHAYRYDSANWRTVMATSQVHCPTSTIRIPYWSDPGNTYGGVSMGTTSTNDNVRVWENRVATVAAFRSVATDPPPAPTGLIVTGSTGQHPYISWNASTGADGYRVYRCSDVSYNCSSFQWIGNTSNTYFTDTDETIGTSCGMGPDEIVWYYVKAYNTAGTSGPSNDDSHCIDAGKRAPSSVPEVFALHGSHPNPFNPQTTIRFDLPEEAYVSLVIYDVLGREVARVVDDEMEAGSHSVRWDAGHLPNGTYLYRFEAGDFAESRRMVLVK